MDVTFTWSKLPTDFKTNVVKSLDHFARCRLRKCSQFFLELVDSVPTTWNRIFLSISRNSILLRLPNKSTIEYLRKSGNRIEIKLVEGPMFYEKVHEVVDPPLTHYDVALTDFCAILKHPENTYKEICIHYLEAIDADDKKLFNRKLFAILNSLKYADPSWSMKTEKLYTFLTTTVEEYSVFLGLCCPETLKCITIKEYNFTEEESKKLVNSIQWKNAKYIDIQDLNPIAIANFLHADTFWTITKNLDATDAWHVIENYVSQTRPRGSTFYVRSMDGLDVSKILEKFDGPLENSPVTSPWRPDVVLHTQKFPIANSNLVLVVIVMAVEITGKICQNDSIDEDCYNFYTSY